MDFGAMKAFAFVLIYATLVYQIWAVDRDILTRCNFAVIPLCGT